MRIIFSSDAIWFKSGYGKSVKNIFLPMVKDHELAHCPMSHGFHGGIVDHSGIAVYSAGNTPYSEDIIELHYRDWDADCLITFKDIGAFTGKTTNSNMEWIPLIPVDHEPLSPVIAKRLRTCFKAVSITEFGKKQLDANNIPNTLIPLGVDTKIYRPMDKTQCKENVGGLYGLTKDTFTMLIVKRNQARANIPRMLEGVRRWIDGYEHKDPRVRVILYTDIESDVNLHPTLDRLNLNDVCMWPNQYMYHHKKMAEDVMAVLLNASDCVLMFTNEGFGMVGLEAQACGVPVLALDYAASTEMVEYGRLVRPSVYVTVSNQGTRYAIPGVDDVADCIQEVYEGKYEGERDVGVKFAEGFDWEKVIVPKWRRFLAECELDLRPHLRKGEVTFW